MLWFKIALLVSLGYSLLGHLWNTTQDGKTQTIHASHAAINACIMVALFIGVLLFVH